MTKKGRMGQQTRLLKTAVAVGSVAAAVLGTQLLAAQDAAETTVSQPAEPMVIEVPITLPTQPARQPNLPSAGVSQPANPGSAPTSSSAPVGSVNLNLPPVPQAITPQINPAPPRQSAQPAPPPVTQTKSSK